jgi:ubiquinone/menaquinone biosynthesis C-methylase UbiE
MLDEQSTEIQIRSAFDSAALVYDKEYESLYGMRRLRSIMWQVYLQYFSPGQRLLELNCGTGTDAVFLAQQGRKVLATDSSPQMIRETRKKIQSTHLNDLASAEVLSYLDLRDLGNETFDGAYSNMAGLNCTNDLDVVASGLG